MFLRQPPSRPEQLLSLDPSLCPSVAAVQDARIVECPRGRCLKLKIWPKEGRDHEVLEGLTGRMVGCLAGEQAQQIAAIEVFNSGAKDFISFPVEVLRTLREQ